MNTISGIVYRLIGEKVKALRMQKKFSQKKLSKELNLSRSSISNIEVGRHHVPLYTLYELSFILGVDIYAIIPSKEEVETARVAEVAFTRVVESTDLNQVQEKEIFNFIKNLGDDNETD